MMNATHISQLSGVLGRRPILPDLMRGDAIDAMEHALATGVLDRRHFIGMVAALGVSTMAADAMADQTIANAENQRALGRQLQSEYDYVIVGAGSAGCVIAHRLSSNSNLRVLLVEAGGSGEQPSINAPGVWFTNIGSNLDWSFQTEPNPALKGRVVHQAMGKALGGGSAINAMAYARGHKHDYDHWAAEVNDPAWSYDSVLKIYKRIEDWQGPPDPGWRGQGGIFWVQPAKDPNPVAPAMVRAAASVGVPSFADHNGRMMEGPGGCAIANLAIKEGRRHSVARTYLYPALDRPNLTVLLGAEVLRVSLNGTKASGVEFRREGKSLHVTATRETILAAGAINTPRILMHSGIGDEPELRRAGIALRHRLPGVGRNYHDHPLLAGCIWEYQRPELPRNNAGECTLFWKSDPRLPTPDLQPFQSEIPFANEVTRQQFQIPEAGWTILPGLVRPKSRGRVRVRSANPADGVSIEANYLAEADDVQALMRGVELCREIGNAPELREFVKREVMPGPLKGTALREFVRDAVASYSHEVGTCRMGLDPLAVVDAELRVHGIAGLRIADGSIMPAITTGNTMMPCVIIGERMAEILKT